MATVQTLARETSWVKGHRLSVGQIGRPVEGSRASPTSSYGRSMTWAINDRGSDYDPDAAWYFATRSAGTRPRSLMS
jgi:hypothetical protein